jgi:exodeoxyribonuclease VIII
MQPGIYDGISNDAYHGGAGISKSGLDILHKSPAHLKAARDYVGEKRETKAMFKGKALHALVLEPAAFVREYTLGMRQSDYPEAIASRDQLVSLVEKLNQSRLPKLSTSGTKAEQIDRILESQTDMDADAYTREELDEMKGAGLKTVFAALNAKREGLLSSSGTIHELASLLRQNGQKITLWSDLQTEWLANNGERTVLDAATWDQLHAMRDSVMSHPAARALLNRPGHAEQSIYWTDPETGTLCRCRPDYLTDDDFCVDLKSTEDASIEGFSKSIANYRYHVQDPFYTDGILHGTGRRVRGFFFIAVEKTAPYAVQVFKVDDESRELGRAEYMRDLQLYAECERTGNWPAYSERIEPIAVPAYYYKSSVNRLAA